MAERGKPLPLSKRMEIKSRHAAGETLRSIAADMGVSKTTAAKFGTRPLKHKS